MASPTSEGLTVGHEFNVPFVRIGNPKSYGSGNHLARAIMEKFRTEIPDILHDNAKV